MEIGKLNQRITILEPTTHTDTIGNHKAQWDEIFSCWACVSIKSSNENSDNGTTKEVQIMQCIVRQNSETRKISTNANCISFQGVIYNITGVFPDFVRKDYIKITAEVRKAGNNDIC